MPPESPGAAYSVGIETVTDATTGLEWQLVALGTFTWSQATTYCDALVLDGQSDWRLPTRIELLSIVDSTRLSGAAINSTFFPQTPPTPFWSATPFVQAPGNAWYVEFAVFSEAYCQLTTSTAAVRCVRGGLTASLGSPPARFGPGIETVVDRVTGLRWQRVSSPAAKTWSQAVATCQGLSLDGFSTGWRLPSRKELESLVDVRRLGGATIDATVFPGTPASIYWTSTPYVGGMGLAWGVEFSTGASMFYPLGNGYDVRCVR